MINLTDIINSLSFMKIFCLYGMNMRAQKEASQAGNSRLIGSLVIMMMALAFFAFDLYLPLLKIYTNLLMTI